MLCKDASCKSICSLRSTDDQKRSHTSSYPQMPRFLFGTIEDSPCDEGSAKFYDPVAWAPQGTEGLELKLRLANSQRLRGLHFGLPFGDRSFVWPGPRRCRQSVKSEASEAKEISCKSL